MPELFSEVAVLEYTLQIGPVGRRGRRRTLVASLALGEAVMPEPEALDARFAALRGLVRARNAETREQVLPDDFPVLVAPITNVRRPNAQEPGVIDITMDAGCFRWRPDHRNAEVREFCGHVADFLLARPPFEEVYTPGPQPSPQVG